VQAIACGLEVLGEFLDRNYVERYTHQMSDDEFFPLEDEVVQPFLSERDHPIPQRQIRCGGILRVKPSGIPHDPCQVALFLSQRVLCEVMPSEKEFEYDLLLKRRCQSQVLRYRFDLISNQDSLP